jgi:hypothetical protein
MTVIPYITERCYWLGNTVSLLERFLVHITTNTLAFLAEIFPSTPTLFGVPHQTSFNRGSDLGTWRRARITGTLEKGGLPCRGPLEVGRKDTGDGHLSCGGSVGMGNPERARLQGTFEMWSWGALGVRCPSPRKLCKENLEGDPPLSGDP